MGSKEKPRQITEASDVAVLVLTSLRPVYLWLFGSKLLSLLQLHVQAVVGAAVHLGYRRRGGGARVTMVPTPVATAAAVRELAAAALHVG